MVIKVCEATRNTMEVLMAEIASPTMKMAIESNRCMSSEHLGQREQFAKVWFPG